MSEPVFTRIGPIRCTWMPHARGTPAVSLAAPWLAAMLRTSVAGLGLWRDRHGRPQLGDAHAGFDANWSHSGGMLLVALGEGVRIGADLELWRPRPRAGVLAERFFAPGEAATLAAMPETHRETAFIRLWCAKEAVLKAHGRGIAFGLDRLEFVPDDVTSGDGLHDGPECRGHGWRLAACDPALGRPVDWTLQAFAPLPGYLATLAWWTSAAVRRAAG